MLFPLLLAFAASVTLADTLPFGSSFAPLVGSAGSAASIAAPVSVAAPVSLANASRAPAAAGMAIPGAAAGERHQLTSAGVAGFSIDALVHAEDAVLSEIRRGGFPGAALAIGRWGDVVVERGIGRTEWGAGSTEVDADGNIYDLASLTKVVAATTAVMLLVEDGRMELDAPVVRYLPEFRGPRKDKVRIRDLLTHTSGLPAWNKLGAPTPHEALALAFALPLKRPVGRSVEYSDIGFVVLWAAAERAAGEPLYRLLDRRVYGPLGMTHTTFLPGEACVQCVPTHRRKDGSLLRGRVHDPIAYRLGGITGNAGLFSTAHDLARFAAMLANGGELDGVRVLQRSTVETFTRRQPKSGTRALGWDTPMARGGSAGQRISPRAFGHTGFTGTSLWVDPERGSWTVILTNRTFEPRAKNRIQDLRRSVHDWVAQACDSGRVHVLTAN